MLFSDEVQDQGRLQREEDKFQSVYIRTQKKANETEKFDNWKMEKFMPFLKNRGGEGLSNE